MNDDGGRVSRIVAYGDSECAWAGSVCSWSCESRPSSPRNNPELLIYTHLDFIFHFYFGAFVLFSSIFSIVAVVADSTSNFGIPAKI